LAIFVAVPVGSTASSQLADASSVITVSFFIAPTIAVALPADATLRASGTSSEIWLAASR